mmetsp:Transcript_119727/g.187798  ORF Transcript_119727/g.187798 Transcript_119727/m.187798 type:complete len:104 (+) Transcript_119727:378-689(+)
MSEVDWLREKKVTSDLAELTTDHPTLRAMSLMTAETSVKKPAKVPTIPCERESAEGMMEFQVLAETCHETFPIYVAVLIALSFAVFQYGVMTSMESFIPARHT